MAPPPGPTASIGLIVVMAGGMAAIATTTEITEDIGEQLRVMMNNTMRDLSVGWLDTLDAQGVVDDGLVHEVRLLVRLDGMTRRIVLDDIVVLDDRGHRVEIVEAHAVRDRDDSMLNGVINDDDLVRLHLPLAGPAKPNSKIVLAFHLDEAAPLHIELGVPRFPRGDMVTLEVLRSW